MKTSFTHFVSFCIMMVVSCKQAPVSDKAIVSEPQQVADTASADETFIVDTSKSKIEWIGTKVSSYHTGTIRIKNGELHLKNEQVSGGKFLMDMNTLTVSGPAGSKAEANAKLQKHLKSADFFEVNTYPEAVFEITAVKPYAGKMPEEENDPRQEEISEYKVTSPTHLVSGNLTIKNITKNIEFPARINVTPSYAEAVAKFNIDRTLWDITYPGQRDDLIRKEINLGISLMTTKQKI